MGTQVEGWSARRAAPWVALPLAMAVATLVSHADAANEITAGFLYLVAVLALATWGGWYLGAVASLVATLCMSFFFVPRTGTAFIHEPDDWVALASFLAASGLASFLVIRARREAEEARRRQRELLAMATEREHLLREAAHLEAVRESEALKTALLRAVSHDLRTPLTAMRLEIESLERGLSDRPEELARVRGLSREQARLTRRIDNLLALARLEAGVARPHPEPTPPGSLLHAAQESLARVLAGRPVEVRVAPGCPDLFVDPNLTLEVLVNLLENAARASRDDLELAAGPGGGPERVWLEVLDRGSGPPAAGYSASGGLGLLIARSLAEANGGSLDLLERPGGGTVARLDLPAATYEELEP
jgi:two-component system sensor histidine kinase KdpD